MAGCDIITSSQFGAFRFTPACAPRVGALLRGAHPVLLAIRMEPRHIALWAVGAALLAAGGLLVGYYIGHRRGARTSSLAKDLRISAQEQRIARLEKALTGARIDQELDMGNGQQSNGAAKAEPH